MSLTQLVEAAESRTVEAARNEARWCKADNDFLFVRTLTLESLNLETLFVVCRYSFKIKTTSYCQGHRKLGQGQRSKRSHEHN